MGRFEEAEQFWLEVKKSEKYQNLRTLNIMGNRYLDLKRRQAEILQNRDYAAKYNLIKQGIDALQDVEVIDDKTAVNLLKSLQTLAHAYYHHDSIELIAITLNKYSYAISRLDKKNKEKNIIYIGGE